MSSVCQAQPLVSWNSDQWIPMIRVFFFRLLPTEGLGVSASKHEIHSEDCDRVIAEVISLKNRSTSTWKLHLGAWISRSRPQLDSSSFSCFITPQVQSISINHNWIKCKQTGQFFCSILQLWCEAVLEDVEYISDKLDFFDRLLAPGDAEYDFYFGADGHTTDEASRWDVVLWEVGRCRSI